MRLCNIYRCKAGGGGCCADCDNATCPNRCLNHPERCHCWVEGLPPVARHRGPSVDVERILSLGRSGLPYAEIAAEVGCSIPSVQKHLNAAGIRRYGRGRSHG